MTFFKIYIYKFYINIFEKIIQSLSRTIQNLKIYQQIFHHATKKLADHLTWFFKRWQHIFELIFNCDKVAKNTSTDIVTCFYQFLFLGVYSKDKADCSNQVHEFASNFVVLFYCSPSIPASNRKMKSYEDRLSYDHSSPRKLNIPHTRQTPHWIIELNRCHPQ